jgi:hypothetical protein
LGSDVSSAPDSWALPSADSDGPSAELVVPLLSSLESASESEPEPGLVSESESRSMSMSQYASACCSSGFRMPSASPPLASMQAAQFS